MPGFQKQKNVVLFLEASGHASTPAVPHRITFGKDRLLELDGQALDFVVLQEHIYIYMLLHVCIYNHSKYMYTCSLGSTLHTMSLM